MNDALLPRLRELTQRRRTIASRYLGSISNPLITIPPFPESSYSVYHLFPVLVSGDRDAFSEHLRLRSIESAVHYPLAISDQPALRYHPFLVQGDLALARHFTERELSLPIHPYLTEPKIERVVDACNSWRNS
jgi:dTDP-4-amino-4,6-dideoxygalactose transaminase